MNPTPEDWELDLLADGGGSEAAKSALAADPAQQRRLEQLRVEESALRAALFRAECPPTLTLGEWSMQMPMTAATAQEIERHVADCPHCAEEVALIQAAMARPVTAAREPVLRRLVMTLTSMMDGTSGGGAPAPVALRGDTWSGLFANGDYMISLTKRRAREGYSLQGSLITPEPRVKGAAQLLLKDSAAPFSNAPLSAAATFTFDLIPSGRYALVVRTDTSELIVEELQFQE